MVSSVSFGNIPYADLIKAPQAHRQEGQQPSAAATLNGEKKSSSGKKAVGTLVGLTAVAAGLVCLAKKGKFDFSGMKDGKIKDILTGEKVQNGIKWFQAKGSSIYDGVEGKAKAVWGWVQTLINKAQKNTPPQA